MDVVNGYLCALIGAIRGQLFPANVASSVDQYTQSVGTASSKAFGDLLHPTGGVLCCWRPMAGSQLMRSLFRGAIL